MKCLPSAQVMILPRVPGLSPILGSLLCRGICCSLSLCLPPHTPTDVSLLLSQINKILKKKKKVSIIEKSGKHPTRPFQSCLFKHFRMIRFQYFLMLASIMFSELPTLNVQFQSDPDVTDEEEGRSFISSFKN